MDNGPTPELFEGDLDDARLRELFTDLASCAEIRHIRMRGSDAATTPTPTLDEARDLLLADRVKAVQIVYRFEDGEWCDTLMRRDDAVRLVRVRQER